MLKEILVVEFEEGKETVLKTQNGEGATYGELVKILYLKAKGENFVSLPVEVASCSNLTDLIYLKLRILSGLKCTFSYSPFSPYTDAFRVQLFAASSSTTA